MTSMDLLVLMALQAVQLVAIRMYIGISLISLVAVALRISLARSSEWVAQEDLGLRDSLSRDSLCVMTLP